MPVAFMLSVLRNEENDLSVRMTAAEKAAPYLHAKLSSIDGKLEADGKLIVEILRFADQDS